MPTRPSPRTRTRAPAEREEDTPPENPAFPVAMLRIALALKLRPNAGLDEIVDDTSRAMGISRRALRAYLAQHMAMLATAATDKKKKTREKGDPVVVSSAAITPRIKTRSPR